MISHFVSVVSVHCVCCGFVVLGAGVAQFAVGTLLIPSSLYMPPPVLLQIFIILNERSDFTPSPSPSASVISTVVLFRGWCVHVIRFCKYTNWRQVSVSVKAIKKGLRGNNNKYGHILSRLEITAECLKT